MTLSTTQQTPSDSQSLHRLANFSFVPFVVRLFRLGRLSEGVQVLPLNQPDALTREAVDAVRDCCNQAALEWLCREAGWQELLFAHRRLELPKRGRLWDSPAWNTLTLEFSEKSLKLLLAAFRYTRQKVSSKKKNTSRLSSNNHQQQAEQQSTVPATQNEDEQQFLRQSDNREKLAFRSHLQSWSWKADEIQNVTTGDLIIHHLVFRGLSHWGRLDQNQIRYFQKNPLNFVTSFTKGSTLDEKRIEQATAAFLSLFRSSLAEFLPWLALGWCEAWVHFEHERWGKGANGYTRFNQHQELLLKTWLEESVRQERYDWLVPLLHYFRAMFGEENQWQEYYGYFGRLFRDVRLSERREYQASWVSLLKLTRELRFHYEDINMLHPIERENAHRVWLEMYENLQFDRSLEEIEALIARLEPRIG